MRKILRGFMDDNKRVKNILTETCMLNKTCAVPVDGLELMLVLTT